MYDDELLDEAVDDEVVLEHQQLDIELEFLDNEITDDDERIVLMSIIQGEDDDELELLDVMQTRLLKNDEIDEIENALV